MSRTYRSRPKALSDDTPDWKRTADGTWRCGNGDAVNAKVMRRHISRRRREHNGWKRWRGSRNRRWWDVEFSSE